MGLSATIISFFNSTIALIAVLLSLAFRKVIERE
jgi:hypothetical protein